MTHKTRKKKLFSKLLKLSDFSLISNFNSITSLEWIPTVPGPLFTSKKVTESYGFMKTHFLTNFDLKKTPYILSIFTFYIRKNISKTTQGLAFIKILFWRIRNFGI